MMKKLLFITFIVLIGFSGYSVGSAGYKLPETRRMLTGGSSFFHHKAIPPGNPEKKLLLSAFGKQRALIANTSFVIKQPVVNFHYQPAYNDTVNKLSRGIAAVFAFPLPFGVLGLHRLYLGTQPIVPVIYILTLGGGFGMLPFIDFVALLLSKDIQQYRGSNKIFMWSDQQPTLP